MLEKKGTERNPMIRFVSELENVCTFKCQF